MRYLKSKAIERRNHCDMTGKKEVISFFAYSVGRIPGLREEFSVQGMIPTE